MSIMDADEKARWLEALRSGRYQQGPGQLMNSHHDEFCCLGVLCDIRDPEGWRYREDEEGDDCVRGWESDRGWFTNDETPDAKFGLPEFEIERLVEMNDSGDDFDTIADYIEANL